ncbi:MAG: hypothetical protein R3F53_05835 [Gammaproteobacteria bacterium]
MRSASTAAARIVCTGGTGGIIWFSIGRGLRPLTALSGQVAQRIRIILPRWLPPMPSEVMPLVCARLFARSESLESERRYRRRCA